MSKAKDLPILDRICEYKPCSLPFKTKDARKKFHCVQCRVDNATAQKKEKRNNGKPKPVREVRSANEFTDAINLSIVTDSLRDRLIRTAQAWDIPLVAVCAQLEALKASGEYDRILATIRGKWNDPEHKEIFTSNMTGRIHTGDLFG